LLRSPTAPERPAPKPASFAWLVSSSALSISLSKFGCGRLAMPSGRAEVARLPIAFSSINSVRCHYKFRLWVEEDGREHWRLSAARFLPVGLLYSHRPLHRRLYEILSEVCFAWNGTRPDECDGAPSVSADAVKIDDSPIRFVAGYLNPGSQVWRRVSIAWE
jgi:hypothetical protein